MLSISSSCNKNDQSYSYISEVHSEYIMLGLAKKMCDARGQNSSVYMHGKRNALKNVTMYFDIVSVLTAKFLTSFMMKQIRY